MYYLVTWRAKCKWQGILEVTACEGKLESQINFHLLRLMDANPPGFMVPAMPEYKTSSRLSPEKCHLRRKWHVVVCNLQQEWEQQYGVKYKQARSTVLFPFLWNSLSSLPLSSFDGLNLLKERLCSFYFSKPKKSYSFFLFPPLWAVFTVRLWVKEIVLQEHVDPLWSGSCWITVEDCGTWSMQQIQ